MTPIFKKILVLNNLRCESTTSGCLEGVKSEYHKSLCCIRSTVTQNPTLHFRDKPKYNGKLTLTLVLYFS